MRKKILTLGGVIGVAGIAAYWYLSPYLALHQMHGAIRARDAGSLNEFIDYPKLRESLKGQLSARMAEEIGKQPSGDGSERAGAAFGAMLGTALVDRMIDLAVRPEAVMHIMQEGELQTGQSRSRSGESQNTAEQRVERNEVQWSSERKGLDKVIVYVGNDAVPDARRGTGIVLEREGFARWKMTEIRLPPQGAN